MKKQAKVQTATAKNSKTTKKPLRVSLKEYTQAIAQVYDMGYKSGYNDCAEFKGKNPAGATTAGAMGYKNGYSAKKRAIKAQNKASNINKKLSKSKA